MTPFTHLAAKSSYSLRDGVMRPRELVVATAQRGMDAIGVADRDGLYGVVRLAQACAVVGTRLIVGADMTLAAAGRPGWEDRRARSHGRSGPGSGSGWLERDTARVMLIARTQAGYANLCRTVSDAHLDAERGSPQLAWDQLERRPDGMFVLLGDDSPVGRLLAAGRADAAEAETRRWMELAGSSSVLLGVTHHMAKGGSGVPSDDERARAWFALADKLSLRAVAHQAPRYLDPSDARVADVVDAVRQQVPVALRHANRRNTEGYLKTPEQMARVFAERPDAIANAAWAAEQCSVDLGLGQLRVPDFVTGEGLQADAELRARCEAGVRQRYADPRSAHRDLLERELAMITKLGLAPYFLTVAEIVDRIREKGIMAACRGSAAGSLVTYALRISDVDPIAHDLAFERFMNPFRDELPDIDIDVESARREDIYRDLLDRYGDDRVACVCMVETFKARMAIREVGKALGLPAGEIDYIAKSFPRVRAGDVRAAMEHLPELRGLNLDRTDLALLFDVVERLDGFPRHIALHPSGVLLADRTLRDIVPLERSAAGFAMAQFDKDDVEALGLCKLDVLAVRMLSSMSHCKEEMQRTRGVELDFDRVPFNDEDTYELIRSTRTLGMFQIESPGQRELVGKFQPEHLDDLVVDISLFRPGPVKGDMVGPFLQRRQRAQAAEGGSASDLRQAKTVYPHPILERALGDTYGVIVYHEQVMRCVAAVTGCDLATADLVRRRLGDPEQLESLHEWIVAGARERGLDEEVAESLWHALAQFASFGFCKAHAAAFAVPTYRSAWLKTHYLPEFVAGLLTHDPGMYPRRLLLDDARQFGVAVLPLDINHSHRDYRVERLRTDEALALLDPRWLVGSHEMPGKPTKQLDATTQLRLPSGFDKGVDPDDPAWRFGIRLALQDVAGIDEKMIDSVLAARPFTSVGDVRRRAALSAPVAEALAHAGAFDEVAGVGTGPTRRSSSEAVATPRTRRQVLLEVTELWSGVRRHRPTDPTAPQQLGLLTAEDPVGLTEYRDSEKVRAELEVLGVDASNHVMHFYRDLVALLKVTPSRDLVECRNGQRVRVAGVKVATQTPPVKSGQRIIFLSLDDGTGVSDSTFFESVHDRCAWTVFHTWLLVVEGTVHRTGRRGVSLNAEVVWDLRRLMRAWREGWLAEALQENRAASRSRPADRAGENFGDGAPAGIAGAAGRSGLRLADEPATKVSAPGSHPGFSDTRQVAAELRAARGAPDPGQVNGKPLDSLRTRPADVQTPAARIRVPRNAPHGPPEVGAPSRVGPNGTTWADPTGRNGNIADQDLYQLPITDPRHPRHVPADEDDAATPRKLWHSSGGSAGG